MQKIKKRKLSNYKKHLLSFFLDGLVIGLGFGLFAIFPKTLSFSLGLLVSGLVFSIVVLVCDISYLKKETKYEKRKKTKK